MTKQVLCLLLVVTGFIQFACKKESGSSGTPTISDVRAVDTTKRDSFFTEGRPGTLIVIQGSNLGGLQAVYFNDTAAFFNPAYATGTNIIVTIPATAQTKATDPNVPSIIKVVTDHGTVTYAFSLFLLPPFINSISFDNSGTMVTINGGNFQGIQKITFPVPGADTALSFSVNKEFSQIVAAIPPGNASVDSIRVYCTFGTAAYSYPPPMSISSVSNENGASGTTITLNGSNFIGVSSITFPGGLLGTNVTPISVNQLSVTVPDGISSSDFLKISGSLGQATSPQSFASYITHPSPGYLCNFDNQYGSDNTGFVGWTGGYAGVESSVSTYPGATGGVGVLQQASPMSANAGATSQGNSGLLQLSPFPWVANTAQSINGYSMKFEIYAKKPWSAGEIWISVGDWYTWGSYTARYAPWESTAGGKFQPAGWQTVTIPLNKFISGNQFYKTSWDPSGSPATKFSDYPTTGVVFMIANDLPSAVPVGSIDLAVDNVRIVSGQ